jgi:hypothetical protein
MKPAREINGYMVPRRFSDMEQWIEDAALKLPEGRVEADWPKEPAEQMMKISTGGPRNGGVMIPEGASGWNAGDIDFRADGAIFIRNPYLADAIERHLQAARRRAGNNKKFFKIVRDEGWSGSETNIVC